MRRLVDRAAVRSSASSRLVLERDGKLVPGAVFYTKAIFQDLAALRLFAYETIGRDLEGSPHPEDNAEWVQIQRGYETLVADLRATNALAGTLAGHRDKSRLHTSWTELVFLGLPALEARVHDAKRAWRDCIRRVGRTNSRRCRSLRLTYEERLLEYVVYAVILADAMRISNYTGAIVGPGHPAHFQVAFTRDFDGKPVGIHSVRIVFRRNDEPIAQLKKNDRNDVSDRERGKDLEPGLVSFVLLWEYLSDVRPVRLRRRGIITDTTAFDIESDGFALFVAGRNGPKKDNATGRFTEDSLAEIFGRTLHRVCVEVLKLNEREATLRSRDIRTRLRNHSPLGAEVKVLADSRWQTVRLETAQQPFGGHRWLFRCPLCGCRAYCLFLPVMARDFGCRHCHAIRYVSQVVSKSDRWRGRAAKLYRRAGSSADAIEHRKPRGMHWRRFTSLIAEAEELEAKTFLRDSAPLLASVGFRLPAHVAAAVR